jgi:poly [ADP-ribose] polymerase
MALVVEEFHAVMSNAANNNNKFWRIFRYDDYSCKVEFGRVGDSGQVDNKVFGDEYSSQAFFNKKTKEKIKKGYTKVDIISNNTTTVVSPKGSLTEVAKKQIITKSTEVEKLIEYFSKVNVHKILESTTMTYNVESGLFSTPIGIVTKDTIDRARDVLNLMLPYVKKAELKAEEYVTLLETYLMMIPKNIGRRFDPTSIFKTEQDLIDQSGILDSLEASIQSVLSKPAEVKTSEDEPEEKKIFDVEVELLNDSNEFDRISKFFKSTSHNNHVSSRYNLKTVYTIDINHMRKAYDDAKDKVGNIMELWHGTRASNILSILKCGLVMPNPRSGNFNGSVFGLGIYFSDQSTKSLNYACGYWGGGSDNHPYMFIADVAMGKAYTPSRADSNLPHPGYDSTFAKAGQSGVINNEMIVYKLEQCNLKYLCEFE